MHFQRIEGLFPQTGNNAVEYPEVPTLNHNVEVEIQ